MTTQDILELLAFLVGGFLAGRYGHQLFDWAVRTWDKVLDAWQRMWDY